MIIMKKLTKAVIDAHLAIAKKSGNDRRIRHWDVVRSEHIRLLTKSLLSITDKKIRTTIENELQSFKPVEVTN